MESRDDLPVGEIRQPGSPGIAGAQVNLFCEDVEACVAFYKELGLPQVFRFPRTGPIEPEMEVAGTRVGLTSVEAANRIASLRVTVDGGRSTETVFWCDGVDELFERALAAGAGTGRNWLRDSQ
jgi:catechol 2,3-dioxygenase-like lactoylglutathione lyase family enzyme